MNHVSSSCESRLYLQIIRFMVAMERVRFLEDFLWVLWPSCRWMMYLGSKGFWSMLEIVIYGSWVVTVHNVTFRKNTDDKIKQGIGSPWRLH